MVQPGQAFSENNPAPLCQALSVSTHPVKAFFPCPPGFKQLLFCSPLNCHKELGLWDGYLPFPVVQLSNSSNSTGKSFTAVFFCPMSCHTAQVHAEPDPDRPSLQPISCYLGLNEAKIFLDKHFYYHRITEWPGLKRTAMIIWFHPPAMCRVANQQTRLPRATSSLALNASRDGASTTTLGRRG